jgi:hypothetical protein
VTEWSNRDKAFLDIARGIRQVVEAMKARASEIVTPEYPTSGMGEHRTEVPRGRGGTTPGDSVPPSVGPSQPTAPDATGQISLARSWRKLGALAVSRARTIAGILVMLAALLFVWYQVQKYQKFTNSNREGFVKNLMEKAFNANNGQYNVMVFNTGQHYEEKFRGLKYHGTEIYKGNINYSIWAFEEGEFTNKGDGGYINWSFKGSFKRSGDKDNHVIFYNESKKLDNYSK